MSTQSRSQHECHLFLQSGLTKDPTGRPMLPAGDSYLDMNRLDLARAFAAVVAACPRYSIRKSSGGFGSKEVVRALFVSIR